MPADGLALLGEADEALGGVEVVEGEGECAAAAAGCFRVEAEDEGVEGGIVAGGGGDVVDLG